MSWGRKLLSLRKKLAAYGDAKRTVGVANGTDALVLPLMAWGVKPGDAVFCPSFTFAATAQIIPWLGATPVFVDVETDTYNMSPAHLDAAIEMIKAGRQAQSQGGDCGRSFWPACKLS